MTARGQKVNGIGVQLIRVLRREDLDSREYD
jgi:hypothetical protein